MKIYMCIGFLIAFFINLSTPIKAFYVYNSYITPIDTPPPHNPFDLPEDLLEKGFTCSLPIEKMPHYIGSDSARNIYINDKLSSIDYKKYNRFFPRKVHVKFTIDTVGKLKNISLIRGAIDSGFNQLIIKTVSEMPNWEPGEQEGKPTETVVIMPIKFKRKEE